MSERIQKSPPRAVLFTAATMLIQLSGCTHSTGAAAPPPPLEVSVVAVRQADVPIYKEWIGTLDGYVNADIKAEISGYLTQQAYTEGTFVRKGQLLFQIDPRPYQATLDQALGRLAQTEGQVEQARAQLSQAEAQVSVAEANQRRVQLDVDRYTPLAQQQAITTQDLDNATQNNVAAKAQLQAAKAQVETSKAQITSATAEVETARINLGFTHLTSPIDGIPGIAQQQVGALVSPASGPVTTVSTVDPIKVYFTASEQEYLDFTRRYPTPEKRQAHIAELQLELILADGIPYPHKGKLYFADRQVDVRTGAIRLAGVFPNPGYSLRPGQYGRVRTVTQIRSGALLVPQQAVMDLQGTRQLAVVDANDKVTVRPVTVGETVGHDWIINSGVHAGERVVVEGVQKVKTGAQVVPKPFQAR
jgi:RND family efflux transporter MFP subunit